MSVNGSAKTLPEIVAAVGCYPAEAFLFVQEGLTHTVESVHGEHPPAPAEDGAPPDERFHVSGRQLCLGLRAVAQKQWGLMARTVLARWNVTSTLDFGKIVFALIEHDRLQKTDRDTLDDFRGVFDFRSMEADYRIPCGADAAEGIDDPDVAEKH